jgi:DNA topoisomerase-2
LGTSTPEEAQEWFRELHEIKYEWDDATDECLSLAFSKKRADDRKKWLAGYDPKRLLTIGKGGQVGFSRFIHDELIHFSNADNIRSLPHLIDGFKPSQRKILFGCLKRGLTAEVRVAQLVGYVSEHAAYHHGEASLTGAIVSMAQTFMGANNINLLSPIGQFGSRLMGGKDNASARYIHTRLEPIVNTIFRKEDSGILKHLDDDGVIVEPETYWPVLPMLLVNGCIGIGTGFSTDIPPFNPNDIIALLRDRIAGRRDTLQNLALQPWWLGFKGRVVSTRLMRRGALLSSQSFLLELGRMITRHSSMSSARIKRWRLESLRMESLFFSTMMICTITWMYASTSISIRITSTRFAQILPNLKRGSV